LGEKEAMARPGRKPIEIDLKTVQTLAAQGLTDEKIYAFLGIGKDTFYRRKREYSEFSDALTKGRATGEASLANKLYTKAMAGTGNSEDIKYILERRFGWGKVERFEGNITSNHEHKHTHEFTVGPAVQSFLAAVGVIADGAGSGNSAQGDGKT